MGEQAAGLPVPIVRRAAVFWHRPRRVVPTHQGLRTLASR
jgi:hypothetical protein